MTGFHVTALVLYVFGGLCLLIGTLAESEDLRGYGMVPMLTAICAEFVFGMWWLAEYFLFS